MKQQIKNLFDSELIRQKAEERLHSKMTSIRSETDILKHIHELEMHQIELEMINDKLVAEVAEQKRSKEELEIILSASIDGFYLVDLEGRILDE